MIDKSILIVDDSDITREMIIHSLKKDYFTLQATDGLAALDILARNKVDLVLTDIVMPKLNGFELLRQIKQDSTLQHIPVIVVTAMDDVESELKALSLGAIDVLLKPLQMQIVLQRVKNVLALYEREVLSAENKLLKEHDMMKVQLQSVFSGSKSGIYRLKYDKSGQLSVIYMNDAFYSLRDIGIDVDIISATEYIHPDDLKSVMEIIRDAVVANQNKVEWENRINTSAGVKIIHCTCGITCVDGDYLLDIVEMDITESKLLRTQLQKANNRLQAMVDKVPAGIAVYEVAMPDMARYMFSNEGLARLLGYDKEEMALALSVEPFAKVHPEDIGMLMEKIGISIQNVMDFSATCRILHKNGHYHWVAIRANVIEQEGEKLVFYVSFSDVDSWKERSDKDALTGLYNRQAISECANRHFEHDCTARGAMFMLDIDNFKGVNDNFGHDFGDKVLVEIAEKLRKIFRSQDIISRIGGDEFCIFILNDVSGDILSDRAEKVIKAVHRQYSNWRCNVEISVSIGIAVAPRNGEDFQSLYKSADDAMYLAKNSGKNNYFIAK
ncbi:MAG: diguanylate cyclase [Oscillospiraceae bacterium]